MLAPFLPNNRRKLPEDGCCISFSNAKRELTFVSTAVTIQYVNMAEEA
jgi:hypothetical protein